MLKDFASDPLLTPQEIESMLCIPDDLANLETPDLDDVFHRTIANAIEIKHLKERVTCLETKMPL